MTVRDAARRTSLAPLAAATLLLGTTACVPDQASTRREAIRVLEDEVRAVHDGMLWHRSLHPTSAGDDALADLADEDYFAQGQASAHPDGTFDVVLPVGSMVEHGGGLFFTQAVVGACVRIDVVPGGADRTGRRGEVSTQPSSCPPGLEPTARGNPAEVVELDLVLHDAVPAPEPPRPGPCYGTSGDCPGG